MRICCELKNKCIVSDNPKVILSLACSSVSLHFWWWRLFLKEEGAWKLLMKVPEVLSPFNSQKVPILRQVFALLICSQLQALCMTYIKLSCFFFFFFSPIGASGTEYITETSTFKELYCNSRDTKDMKSQCWFSSFCLCISTKIFFDMLDTVYPLSLPYSVFSDSKHDMRWKISLFFPFLAIHCACTSCPLCIIQAMYRGGELSWATCKHSLLIFPVLPKGKEVVTS